MNYFLRKTHLYNKFLTVVILRLILLLCGKFSVLRANSKQSTACWPRLSSTELFRVSADFRVNYSGIQNNTKRTNCISCKIFFVPMFARKAHRIPYLLQLLSIWKQLKHQSLSQQIVCGECVETEHTCRQCTSTDKQCKQGIKMELDISKQLPPAATTCSGY